MCDTVAASYFHNIFPGAFGSNPDGNKSSSEVDFIAQPELLGMPQYRKRNNDYGDTRRDNCI